MIKKVWTCVLALIMVFTIFSGISSVGNASNENIEPNDIFGFVITTDPVVVIPGGSAPVSVQAYDQFAAPMPCTPVWSDDAGGSFIDVVPGSPATATYLAPVVAPGSYTITAQDGVWLDTATLKIYTQVLTSIIITPDPVNIPPGFVGSTPLVAQGLDQFFFPMNCMPAWSDDSAGTTYSSVVAGNPATANLDTDGTQINGVYTITAQDGPIFDTAVLTISGPPPLPPTDVSAHKSGDDIVIDWTDGTGPFEIWRSNNVDGTGFALYDSTASNSYTDIGALADDNNYSYAVCSSGGFEYSNLAFKLCRPLSTNGLAYHWISLPYKTDLAVADDLMDDINLHGPGGDTCDIATNWAPFGPGFSSRIDIGAIRLGDNFALVPGIGYQVHVIQNVTWKIVGANQDLGTDITIDLPYNSLAYRWVAFPYNTGFANADEVMDQINADGPGGDSCDKLTRWYEPSQGFSCYVDIGPFRIGRNFEIQPGYGYQVHTTAGHENPAWIISQNTVEP